MTPAAGTLPEAVEDLEAARARRGRGAGGGSVGGSGAWPGPPHSSTTWGFALLFPKPGVELPSLWDAASDRPIRSLSEEWGPDAERVWGWKDELPRRGLAWYGRFLRGRPSFLAPDLLADLYPRSGRRDDFDEEPLSPEARRIARILLRSGPQPTSALREALDVEGRRGGERFEAALTELGRRLVVTHFGVEDEGAGWPSAVLELTARAFQVPRRRDLERARLRAALRFLHTMVLARPADLAHAFGWTARDARAALDHLVRKGRTGGHGLRVRPGWEGAPALRPVVDPVVRAAPYAAVDVPDLSPVRERFPALARIGPDSRPFAFLDAPGGTQVPEQVIEAIASYLRTSNANLHGAFETSRETDRVVEEARRAGADLLGADPGEVVFGPNATTLLFHLSRSIARELRPGDEVVVTRLDHDANVAPWLLAAEGAGARVRWVDLREEDATLDEGSFEAALGERTRLVAFTLASNAVGTIPPAASLARRAREAGAIVVCDGVHLAQHRLLDVGALGADVVVCSPYKVFGPHLGMLWARRELLERWRPAKVRPAPDEPPARWETGTQSHEALAGWAAAVEYLADLGRRYGRPAAPGRRAAVVAAFDAIARYEAALADRFLAGLEALPHVRLYGIGDRRRLAERTPTFAVRVGSQHPAETARALAARGIFVWDGNYYALEVMERLGLEASGGAVRIGFCHYATAEEVDRVLEELGALR